MIIAIVIFHLYALKYFEVREKELRKILSENMKENETEGGESGNREM